MSAFLPLSYIENVNDVCIRLHNEKHHDDFCLYHRFFSMKTQVKSPGNITNNYYPVKIWVFRRKRESGKFT